MTDGRYEPSLAIDKLIPSAVNVNKLGKQKMAVLQDALREGMRDPVEVCVLTKDFIEYPGEDGYFLIVDGHHRVEGCREIGRTAVPAMVFEYSVREARLRMMQTNTLRGQQVREKTGALIRFLAMSDAEFQAYTGIRRDEVRKLRELKPKPTGDEEKTVWKLLRFAIAEDAKPIVDEAMRVANFRVKEMIQFDGNVDQNDLLEQLAGYAMMRPNLFFSRLDQMLKKLEVEISNSTVLVGEGARLFEVAMMRAKGLADSEAAGHVLSLICADFLSGLDDHINAAPPNTNLGGEETYG